MKALSKSSNEINEPIAFFEISMDKSDGVHHRKMAKFEMNREETQQMLQNLQEIQNAYDRVSSLT